MNDCELIFFQCPGLKVSDCCCYCGICVTLIVDLLQNIITVFVVVGSCCFRWCSQRIFVVVVVVVQDKDTKRSRNRIDRQAILLGTFNNNKLLLGYSEKKIIKYFRNCPQIDAKLSLVLVLNDSRLEEINLLRLF